MKISNLRQLFIVAAFALLSVSVQSQMAHAADVWTTDLAAAKAQAAAEKKDILILFTGSTWCPYCIKLNDKVLSQASFEADAPKDFVLVKIDFPKDLKTSSKESLALAQQYGIQGFPTVILADEAGSSYAQTEYFKGINAQVYLGHLKVMKDDATSARQKFAEGDASADDMVKAQKYHEAIELMTDNGAPIINFIKQVKHIAVKDTNDTLLFSGSVSYRTVYVSLVTQVVSNLARAGELMKAHAVVDLLLAEITLKAEEKQAVLFGLKGRLYELQGDAKKAIETYKEAIAAAPTSKLAAQIEAYIKELEKTQSDVIDVN